MSRMADIACDLEDALAENERLRANYAEVYRALVSRTMSGSVQWHELRDILTCVDPEIRSAPGKLLT